MKLFYFCYHANYQTHSGEFWAASRYEVEKMILRVHTKATDIHIWLS
jgi:hypothetical protein